MPPDGKRVPAERGSPGSPVPRIVAFAVTVVGIVALGAAAKRLSGGVEALLAGLPFLVWALLPFALALFGLRRGASSVLRSIGIVLTSGFGLLMYGDLALASRLSSTAGLASLFVPLWQLIGCAVVLLFTMRKVRELWGRPTTG